MNVTIFGTGTWGTALAQVLSDNGHNPLIYGIEQTQVDDINHNHRNSFYFGSDVVLSNNIVATSNFQTAIDHSEIYLLAVPSVVLRSLLTQINEVLKKPVTIINTAKGFDNSTNKRLSELVREIISPKFLRGFVSLIGPSHAEEVVIRLTTLITATSLDIAQAEMVQNLFSNGYFRVYTQTDELGAELAVAYKNAIAIASGVLFGLGYGDNARAALITRGLAEMVRFGQFYGAEVQTFLGLTGLGDLVVTCNSVHSRNFQAGFAIGKADSATAFLNENTKTVEGIRTTQILHRLAKQNGLELPIIEGIYKVLYEHAAPSVIIKEIMIRPLKHEFS